MGRKKGKQSGDFPSKLHYALHRQTLYHDVDHRTSMMMSSSSSSSSSRALLNGSGRACFKKEEDYCFKKGYWHTNGTFYGGRDKWSMLFSSSLSSSSSSTANNNNNHNHNIQPNYTTTSNRNLHRYENNNRRATSSHLLRSLLEERRNEDRWRDREYRFRLVQRLHNIDNNHSLVSTTTTNNSSCSSSNSSSTCWRAPEDERHEPGWLLSHQQHQHHRSMKKDQQQLPVSALSLSSSSSSSSQSKPVLVPLLQLLAAQVLGPVLPLYCTACGAEFVGKLLKSISAEILSELTVALATNYSLHNNNNNNNIVTTNGVVKAIMYSSVATGIVLRGRSRETLSSSHGRKNATMDMTVDDSFSIDDDDDDKDDDENELNDNGLLLLCPRLLPIRHCTNPDLFDEDDESAAPDESSNNSSWENWEIHDFDMNINSRMVGCFHLKCLELIDIPLQHHDVASFSGGITIQALWSLLRSCPGITHLSLSGCFHNWTEAAMCDMDDIRVLLGGNESASSFTNCVDLLQKRGDNSTDIMNSILHYLDFHASFEEQTKKSDKRRNDIPAINSILPDLIVLDVSYCVWVTPEMIMRMTLNGWKRCFASIPDNGNNYREWDDAVEENMIDHSMKNVFPTLRHINIRGCTLSECNSQLSWIEEWRRYGVFDGMDISTNRQVRT